MQATLSPPHQAVVQRWSLRVQPWLAVAATVALVAGGVWHSGVLLGGGALALAAVWYSSGVGLRFWTRRPLRGGMREHRGGGAARGLGANAPLPDVQTAGPHSETMNRSAAAPVLSQEKLVEQMIAQRRYALLLRPEIASQLSRDEVEEVLAVMDEAMSVVPEGRVLVGEYADRATWGATPGPAQMQGLEEVAGCYLDRYTVTNADFQHFVDAGGYEQFALWHEEALPALFEFVDRTGTPGPAFWYDGQFPQGEDRLPVVGISWYEAAAYARWVGKRLPTDAEWTKAGAWPVETSPGRITQRRYPWGDTFEARRAALWGSGQKGPVAVDCYEEGATLGGIHQLIGNVWEWTCTPLDATSRETAAEGHSLKVIHGGAFNTYFENQATCHFRSGERPLARRANLGLRLALSIETVADTEEGALGPTAQQSVAEPAGV